MSLKKYRNIHKNKKPSYLENYQLTSMRNLKNFDNYPLFNVLNDKS